jgi:hypothetical protein
MQSWMRGIVGALVLGILVGVGNLGAQSPDKWVGTWQLNVAKSTYSGTPAPKSVTVVIAKADGGIKVTATAVNAEDKTTTTEYTTAGDGKDVPVTGSADYDMVSVKMLDASTRHMVRKKGGKEVQTVHSVLAADGKSFTSTTTGVNAKGDKIKTVAVYDKQ